jgi:hypothetical protein
MRAFLAAAFLCLFAIPASAFDRHDPSNPWRQEWSAPSPYQKRARSQKVRHAKVKAHRQIAPDAMPSAIAAPVRYIAGKLVCAINVNAELARRGIQGTGSALAKSYLHWGRSSEPVPGAVAVYNRGKSRISGHVAIVSRVEGGRVYVWNPGRRGWREVVYPRAAISYRVASL